MPPLVLLAGMNCTADLWTGCGVDDAVTPPLVEDAMDRQVERLLADLPPVFVIGGLSLGAIVAMALAVRAPERVAGLALAATNAKAPTDAQRSAWSSWEERVDAGIRPRALQEEILGVLLSEEVRQTRPDVVERTLRMGAQTPPAQLVAQLRLQATRTDLRPGLRGLRMPTLVVSGERDALCPPVFHDEIAACIPHAQRVTLAAGHLIPLERPDAFGAALREWRAGLSPAPSAASRSAP